MHTKLIKGRSYYYTTQREGSKTKTIYLGSQLHEAKQKELALKGGRTHSFFFTFVLCLLLVGGGLTVFLMKGTLLGSTVLDISPVVLPWKESYEGKDISVFVNIGDTVYHPEYVVNGSSVLVDVNGLPVRADHGDVGLMVDDVLVEITGFSVSDQETFFEPPENYSAAENILPYENVSVDVPQEYAFADVPPENVTEDISGNVPLEAPPAEQPSIVPPEPIIPVPQEPLEDSNKTPLEVPPENNISEEPAVHVPENISEEILPNESVPLPPVNLTPQPEINLTNKTLPKNLTHVPVNLSLNLTRNVNLSNETLFKNLTKIPLNLSLNFTTNVTLSPNETLVLYENVLQASAIVGVPVQWTKHVVLFQESNSLEVLLPQNIDNVTVKEIVDNVEYDVDPLDLKVNESGVVLDLIQTNYAGERSRTQPLFAGAVTGFAVLDTSDLFLKQMKIWFTHFWSDFISITGFAVAGPDEGGLVLIIEEPVQEVFIDYYTPAPQAAEENTSSGKHVTITSSVSYDNVTAFTNILNVPPGLVQLYYVTNGTYASHPFTEHDTDGDNRTDMVAWVIPYLSSESAGEEYEVTLNILTVQSYPLVGGNWTVAFNTTGTADLTIRAVDGTEFGRDIDFLEVRCGDAVLTTSLTLGEVSIPDYSCADTGIEVSRVLLSGVHTLEFTYGTFVAYAYNDATSTPTQGAAIINSSSGSNITTDNLTIYNVSTADADGDPVKNIYNWQLNDALLNYLNVPMEGGSNSTWTRNYANFSTYGRVINSNWTNTSGYDRKGAYHFNGTTDVIEIYGTEPLGDDLKNFSVEYWFMRNESGTQINNMIAAVAKGGGFPNGFAAGILETNGTIVWVMQSTPYATTWTVQNGTWYHVVFAIETNNVTIYVNGVANISRTVQASAIGLNNVNITIGALQTGVATFGGYFNGTIDEVRIWNMSLTAQQVDLLYRNQSNVIHSSLTIRNDNFTGQIYPNDLFVDGAGVNASLVILNAPPTIGSLVINSTLGTNLTTENISVYNLSSSDADDDTTKNIYNWYKNDNPIAILNMPFEGGSNATFTKDYSGLNHNANSTGQAIWNSTGGYDGHGAYEFKGVTNQKLHIGDDNSQNLSHVGHTLSYRFKADPFQVAGNIRLVSHTGSGAAGYTTTLLSTTRAIYYTEISTANGLTLGTPTGVNDSKWHQLTVVVNIAGANATLYLDGSAVVSDTFTGDLIHHPTSLTIGDIVTTGVPFNGTIDEVMIFNQTLTPQQVRMLYANQSNMISSTMITSRENWTAQVYPADNTSTGTALNASLLVNTPPTITNFFMNTTDPQNRTNGTINVSFGTSDTDGDTVRYQVDWYLNTVLNTTFANHTSISAGNTTQGNNFTAIVAVFDGTAWGANKTGTVIITNAPPTIGSLVINSTLGTNLTTENISVYNISSFDEDNDTVKNIYNWYRNDGPIAILNMPFEGGSNATFTKDYSGANHNGNITGSSIVWNATGGYDGNGAYNFNGANVSDELNVTNMPTNMSNGFTFVAWIYPRSFTGKWGAIFASGPCLSHFYITMHPSNVIRLSYHNSSNIQKTFDSNAISANKWWHVAVTLYPNSTATIYLNGRANTTSAQGGGIKTSTSANARIGYFGHICGLTYHAQFNGTIDEVMLFNESLTSQQVAMLYANQSNMISSTMLTSRENWTAQVYPVDNQSTGTALNASLLVNTPPTINNFFINTTDPQNRTNGTINVSFGTSDTDGDTVRYQVDWYLNTQLNTTFANQTSISAGNTTQGNNFTAIVAVFDGTAWGTNQTGTVIITNTPPSIGRLVINSTFGKNASIDNLSVYNISSFDEDNDTTKNIYNWYKNDNPIAILNMPFEGGSNATFTKNYGGNGRDGNVTAGTSIIWNSTGGYDGRGAYHFSGANTSDIINFTGLSANTSNGLSASVWVYPDAVDGKYHIITARGVSCDGRFYLAIDPSNSFKLNYENASGVQKSLISNVISANKWWHVAVTINRNSTITMYLNGKRNATVALGQGVGSNMPTVGGIGNWGNICGSPFWLQFNGTIDEVMWFNESLTSQQVMMLYANQSNMISSTMITSRENWTAQVYPTDNTSTGTALNASLLVNTPPTINNFFLNTTDSQNRTNGTINVSFGISDTDGGTVRYQVDWWLNNVLNMTFANHTSISAGNTTQGNNFTAIVAVNDGTSWGANKTGTVIITNTPPSIGRLVINSTNNNNLTTENITVYNISSFDEDNDTTKNIYNWYKNDNPIAILNLPFEGGSNGTFTKDYSGANHNGNITGSSIVWNATGGYDGNGAYDFSGANVTDEINVTRMPTNMSNGFTIVARIYPRTFDGKWHAIFAGGACLEHFYFAMTPTNTIRLSYANASAIQKTLSSNVISANKWWHVAVTLYPNSTATMYLNGKANVTSSQDVRIKTTTIAHSRIGYFGHICGLTYYAQFNGTIDEVMFFNESLTAQQVAMLYANQSNMISSTMITSRENWTAQVYPTDNASTGTALNASLLVNTPPTINNFFLNTTDSQNRTNGTINVSFGISDTDGDTVRYQIDWYLNTQLNTTFANHTSISAGNTTQGNNFTAIVAVNDGTAWGANKTGTVIITNTPPSIGSLVINSTLGTNLTTENISVYNISSFDEDDETTKNIYNWYKNDNPIAILNMPFEGGSNATFTKDYSGANHNGNITGSSIVWNATGGYDGKGAYDFSGANVSDEINFTRMPTNMSNGFTVVARIYPRTFDGKWHTIFSSDSCNPHFYIAMNPTNTIIFSYRNASESQKTLNSNVISANKWWHVAVTLYPNSTATIYLNGKANATSAQDVRIKTAASAQARIGYFGTICGLAYHAQFNGTIDEVMWFNESLTSQQVEILYANQSHIISSTMITSRENWTAQVYPTDNTSTGTALNASLLVNTPPTINNFFLNTTDSQNRTNGTINVSFGISDTDGGTVRYQVDWWLNNVLNMTFANHTSISAGNTTKGDNFTTIVAVNDGTSWGANKTGTVIITNTPPSIGRLVINSTFGKNASIDNLSVYNISSFDEDNDTTKNVYQWYRNGAPFEVLNMPFDSNNSYADLYTKDYSSNNNSGLVSGPFWNSSGGYDGRGAYNFTLGDGTINITDSDTLDFTSEATFALWFKSNISSAQSLHSILYKGNTTAENYLIGYQTNGKLVARNGSNVLIYACSGSTGFSLENRWQHLAYRFNGSRVYYYINGTLVCSTGLVFGLTGTDPLVIGGQSKLNGSNSMGPTDGYIDELRIYNASLSDDQIKLLYLNQTNVVHSAQTSAGDNWTAQVSPVDNQSTGTSLNASLLVNTPPTIANFFINTSFTQNLTNATVNASFSISDVDSDTLMYQVDWYLNTILNTTFANQTNITVGNTTRGDNFTPIVAVFDGKEWGTNATSTVIIINDPPTEPSQTSPANATRTTGNNQSLTCSSTDLDNDPIYFDFYADTSNPPTTLKQNKTGTTYGLSTTDGQTYWWYCKAHDNSSNSGNSPIRAFTENTAPTISGLNVNTTFTANLTNATVNASFSTSDAESDTMRYQIDWYLNNVLNMTFANQTNVSAGNTTGGDNFTAIVAVNDGYEWTNATSTVIIANTPPVFTTDLIINSSQGANRTVENISVFNRTIFDEDNDPVKNIYNWYYNNTPFYTVYLPFEGGSNATFTKDYSGRNNSANMSGGATGSAMQWNSTGGFDGKGAYTFDGVDSFISLPNNPDFTKSLENEFTIMAWIYNYNDSGATGEQIFDTNGSTPNRENIQLVEGGNARLTLRLSNGTANTLYGANATTVIPGRTWTHVTATYKNGSHVRLYINGTKRTDQAPVTQLIAMDQPTFIGGKGPSGQARSFNGSIDEFIIINKSLTDNQILLYYRNQSNVIHSTTTVKENWTGQVYPTDNASTGTALNASLQIVNSVANITNFFINTTDPQNRSNGTINVSFDLEDVDNDSVRYQVDWDLNTVLNKTFANQTNISPGNTSRGNNFSAVVAAFDETSWSTNQTGSVVITNTAPTPADITNPNATDIWNGTKLINWTASTDIDELDTWYYNLTLINSDNTANATIATLLSQSATNYSWNASSVKDGQFRINITTTENNTDEKFTVTNVSNLFNISTTETISAVEAAPSVSAGSSGDSGSSGGGGGEKKEKVVLGFEIDTKELQFELARGEAEEKIFTIKNTGTAPQTFALSVEGVDAMLTVVPERFVLGPGEEKVVIAYVISSDETGIFTGNVRVETDGGSKELPVVIEVESKTVLFDARLSLDPVFVALTPGDNLPVEVTLFSIGAPRNVDVELRYSLRDIYGNLLWTSSETMAVENQKTFSKDFALPGDLSDGMYVLGLEVLYLNSVATSTVTFDVLKSLDTIYGVAFFKQNFVLFLTFVVVVFVTLAGAYILYQTRNGGKRRG